VVKGPSDSARCNSARYVNSSRAFISGTSRSQRHPALRALPASMAPLERSTYFDWARDAQGNDAGLPTWSATAIVFDSSPTRLY